MCQSTTSQNFEVRFNGGSVCVMVADAANAIDAARELAKIERLEFPVENDGITVHPLNLSLKF